SRSPLREPAAALLVAEDDDVLAALEHDLEVPPRDRLLRPPAVDDAPLLADELDRLAIDPLRRPVEALLDERPTRLVQSRGTSSARSNMGNPWFPHGPPPSAARLFPPSLGSARAKPGSAREGRRVSRERRVFRASSVTRNEKGALLGNPRPGRDLHDACNGACARARAHLAQAFPETGLPLVPRRRREGELTAARLGQRKQLDPQGEHRCGKLRELRPERRPQSFPLRARLAQRHRAPPRAAADEPREERDLADLPPAALGAGEDPVEQCRQGPPESELVRERLRELQPVGDLRRRPPGRDLRRVVVPRQAPGAPAVRPQSFGNGSARQPGKLSDLLHPEALELLAPLVLERQEGQRERREEL